MYVCISFFRVDQTNSTTLMTNKNRLTPHTDQKWRHDLALYLSLLQSSMFTARFILNSGEHEVLRFIQLDIKGTFFIFFLNIGNGVEFRISSETFFQSWLALYAVLSKPNVLVLGFWESNTWKRLRL